jgi:hypothetical protein
MKRRDPAGERKGGARGLKGRLASFGVVWRCCMCVLSRLTLLYVWIESFGVSILRIESFGATVSRSWVFWEKFLKTPFLNPT